jgi:prepilin-type N-terminal cleavage/methylation domain-containing protein
MRQGFTLLEIILVTAVMGVLTAMSVGVYRNLVKRNEVDLAANNIIFELKRAQSSAQSGVDNRRWGVRLTNGVDDYFELFSTPTVYGDASTTIENTTYLAGTIFFTDPIDNTVKDIIFEKIRGTATSTVFSLSSFDGFSRIININELGKVN